MGTAKASDPTIGKMLTLAEASAEFSNGDRAIVELVLDMDTEVRWRLWMPCSSLDQAPQPLHVSPGAHRQDPPHGRPRRRQPFQERGKTEEKGARGAANRRVRACQQIAGEPADGHDAGGHSQRAAGRARGARGADRPDHGPAAGPSLAGPTAPRPPHPHRRPRHHGKKHRLGGHRGQHGHRARRGRQRRDHHRHPRAGTCGSLPPGHSDKPAHPGASPPPRSLSPPRPGPRPPAAPSRSPTSSATRCTAPPACA